MRAVQAALAPLADAEKATGVRACMRGRFEYLGIPTLGRRTAQKFLSTRREQVSGLTMRVASKNFGALAKWKKT